MSEQDQTITRLPAQRGGAIRGEVDESIQTIEAHFEFLFGLQNHLDNRIGDLEETVAEHQDYEPEPAPRPTMRSRSGMRAGGGPSPQDANPPVPNTPLPNAPAVPVNTIVGIIIAITTLAGTTLSGAQIQAWTVIIAGAFLILPIIAGYVIRAINAINERHR